MIFGLAAAKLKRAPGCAELTVLLLGFVLTAAVNFAGLEVGGSDLRFCSLVGGG